MGTILLKKPAASAAKELSEVEMLIDLVGSQHTDAAKLKKKIKDLQAELKKFSDNEAKLQKLVDDLPNDADDQFVLRGASFRAEIGVKGSSRSISDMMAVRDMLGDKTFMELAKVNLKDIDNYLTLPQREKVLAVARTQRSISIEKI